MLLLACAYLVRPPVFRDNIAERLYYSFMPILGAWAICPPLIERRMFQWALCRLYHRAPPTPVSGTWRDIAFIFLLALSGAVCLFAAHSWMLKAVPPGPS
jgi:hypothetical protein